MRINLVPTAVTKSLHRAHDVTPQNGLQDKDHQTDSEAECAADTCRQCCQEFSTILPYSFNIFLPGTDDVVRQFLNLRTKLSTTFIRCRLRLGVNTFKTGCVHGPERILRVEARTEEELIRGIDRLAELFPTWGVWKRGKVDNELIY